MRLRLVVGNWKMYLTVGEAAALARALVQNLGDAQGVVFCPPFVSLTTVAAEVRGTGIMLGAQNTYWENEGAFTGEVAPGMLSDLGCRYVIVGHSERRQLFGETDADVRRKVVAVRRNRLVPIVCVGETLAQREAGQTRDVIGAQIAEGLSDLPPEVSMSIVVAYEPIWAIGTGRTATPIDAQEVCVYIRSLLEDYYGLFGNETTILYGGSVKAANAAAIMRQRDIDGVLVGGASLSAVEFTAIARA